MYTYIKIYQITKIMIKYNYYKISNYFKNLEILKNIDIQKYIKIN